jgi:type IV pilus assembly protein PilB
MPRNKTSLAESLVGDGLLTKEQLAKAHAEEKRSGERLRKVIVRLGFVNEEDLVSFLSGKWDVPRIELSNQLINPAVIENIPEALARKYELIPILKIGKRLTCAMVDPLNIFALDEVRMKTGFTIEPAVATEQEIKKALNEYYGAKGTLKELVQSIDEKKLGIKEGQEVSVKELEGMVEEPVVIRLVNLIIMQALREGASDVHIQPEEDNLQIRFRVDGMLHESDAPPKHLHSAIVSRIKVLADLDIAERRKPQDGRFHLKMEGKETDIRVSCLPTIYGENVVMRLLDVSGSVPTLSQIGFSKEMLPKMEKVITRPHGIILVTGPTGSGKTTTLYAGLSQINTPEKNIITIENPVEYHVSGIRQIQVNAKVGLTFANGLRSILRQDPDVIMVGEIRDQETAEIAIQAALTGHLVFSTLHTNDAPSAVTRMIDMGVEPFMVSSTVVGILAQRLVRLICKDCQEDYAPEPETLRDLGLDNKKLKRGKGCDKCMKTGFKGRIGIFELLIVDPKIRALINNKASLDEIRNQTKYQGMKSLKEDGLDKIRQGLTTPEEVLRVTHED